MANLFGWNFDLIPGVNVRDEARKNPLSNALYGLPADVVNPNVDLIPGVGLNEKGRSNAKTINPVPQVPTLGVPDSVAAGGTAGGTGKNAARIGSLRGDIKNKQGAVMAAYDQLFGDLDNLGRDRSRTVEEDAGKNIGKLTQQYTSAIPGIESSYSAIGAGDSTDTRDAKIGAKQGFDDSVEEVGKTKDADLAKIGQYINESKGKYGADKDSILRLISRVDETEDEGDLNAARNSVEDKLGTLGAERATLGTDAGARGQLSSITADAGRFDSVKSSLDNILASSLSGGVKAAAVQAIADSADLSPEDKEKVKLQYGNVYNAPVA